MKKNQISLTEGNIAKSLILFCLPIMAGSFFQQLYNTVDVLVVGNFVGSAAIASVGGSAGIIINMIVGIFVGLSSGVTVVVSRSFGGRQFAEIKREISTAILMAILGSIVAAIIGFIFTPRMLTLLNTPEEIIAGSTIYLQIYFGGLVFLVLFNICSGILRALGNSKTPLYFLMICCAINVILDVVLVAILGMGVAGVAIATVASQGVSALLSLRYLTKLNHEYRFDAKKIVIDCSILRYMLRIGCPAAFQSMMNIFSGMFMTRAINALGTAAVSGNTTYAKMDGIFWLLSNAFGVAIATYVSQNIGSGQYQRAKKGIYICLGLYLTTAAFMSLFYFHTSGHLFGLFTSDADVILQARLVMLAIAPYYMIVPFYDVFIGAMRGMDDVIVPMIINILGLCGIRILWIVVVLPNFFPQNNIYDIAISCPVSWVITALAICTYYFLKHQQNS